MRKLSVSPIALLSIISIANWNTSLGVSNVPGRAVDLPRYRIRWMEDEDRITGVVFDIQVY